MRDSFDLAPLERLMRHPRPEGRNEWLQRCARVNIHAALVAAGWVIQDRKSIDFRGGRGIAVREFQTAHRANGLPALRRPEGRGDARGEEGGVTLGSVEPQTQRYSDGLAEVAEKRQWQGEDRPHAAPARIIPSPQQRVSRQTGDETLLRLQWRDHQARKRLG